MKNLIMTRNAQVVLPLAVASGVTAGDVVLIGDQGLLGLALTDRFLTADYGTEVIATPPQGLANGEASVELLGVSAVVALTVAGTQTLGDAVYRASADGTYTHTATDNNFIGWDLGVAPDGAAVLVGLAPFTPTVVTS